MDALLRPAMGVMRRLGITGKFALIAVVLVVPLLIGVGTNYRTAGAEMAQTREEQAGLEYITPVSRLVVQIGRLHDGLLNGIDVSAISMNALEQVDRADVRLGARFGVHDDWIGIRAVLVRARQAPPAPETPTTPAARGYQDRLTLLRTALQQTVTLLRQVADRSMLTLDPELDVFYAIETLVQAVPDTMLDRVDLRRVGWTGVSHADYEARAHSVDLALRAREMTQDASTVRHNLAQAWRQHDGDALRDVTAPAMEALVRSSAALAAGMQRPDAPLALLNQYSSAVASATLELATGLLASLQDLLDARLGDQASSRRQPLVLSVLALLATAYLLSGLARATKLDARHILAEINGLSTGEVSSEEPLRSRDEFGAMSDAVMIARDRLTSLLGALRYQATHDELTALANRRMLMQKIEEALDADGGTLAVVVLDLDGFKDVNDSFGQVIGDQLLRTIGARLHKAVRRRDVVARLGGDDFGLLLPRVRGEQEIQEVVGRLRDALAAPVLVGGRQLSLRMNAGIAIGSPGSTSSVEMLRDAELAKYVAKEAGSGQVATFEPWMHRRVADRAELSADLVHAVERGEMALLYQPIVDLADGSVHGVEALVRWQHPTRGMVMPNLFVPLAEATGAVTGLGRWVLREAAHQLATWNAMFPQGYPLTMDINISATHLGDERLVEDLLTVLDETGVDPRQLVLEITESALLTDMAMVVRRMRQLSAIGVRVALDDFGTGYSSLSYLRTLPVSVLKIDKSFVSGLADPEGNAAAVLRAVVGLGASLGMETVAEGIEDAAQELLLRELGCSYAQGFRYSWPLTPQAVADMLRGNGAGDRWLPTGHEAPAISGRVLPHQR